MMGSDLAKSTFECIMNTEGRSFGSILAYRVCGKCNQNNIVQGISVE